MARKAAYITSGPSYVVLALSQVLHSKARSALRFIPQGSLIHGKKIFHRIHTHTATQHP